jgi:hypothetical protein
MTNLILEHSLQAILQTSCVGEEGDEEHGFSKTKQEHTLQPLSICVIPLLVSDAKRLLSILASSRRRRR